MALTLFDSIYPDYMYLHDQSRKARYLCATISPDDAKQAYSLLDNVENYLSHKK
jgi:hypothetical protein